MTTLTTISERFGKTLVSAFALGIALSPANALAVTTWNWSFSTNISDQFGSGTFTTADVTPTAGTSYEITGISGTYNRGGTAYSITGLSYSPQYFQWDGTSSSSILVDISGFNFDVSSGNYVYIFTASSGYVPAAVTDTNFSGTNGTIASSLLSPVTAAPGSSAAAPGPLPLLGAAAAFRASRRLRRRLSGTVPSV